MKALFKKQPLTSLQGPPNVHSPAAWSAMARLSVWNQSSRSPTELETETDKWVKCELWEKDLWKSTPAFSQWDSHLADSVMVMSETSILRQFSTSSMTGLVTCDPQTHVC